MTDRLCLLCGWFTATHGCLCEACAIDNEVPIAAPTRTVVEQRAGFNRPRG